MFTAGLILASWLCLVLIGFRVSRPKQIGYTTSKESFYSEGLIYGPEVRFYLLTVGSG